MSPLDYFVQSIGWSAIFFFLGYGVAKTEVKIYDFITRSRKASTR